MHSLTLGTLACALLFSSSAAAQVEPHGAMLRYPDIGPDSIVFVYADDLWLVPRDGGVATPLASPPGLESFPRFSPDGKTIAFVGNYDGNRDLYTVPVDGGVPSRVTHHPSGETMCDWTRDGDLIFMSSGFAGVRQTQLFRVDADGGLPSKLPVPYGAFGSFNASGEWLAYVPHSRDHRTWKRYRGGMATDIWIFNVVTKESRKITDWEGTDSLPMWNGSAVYYLSDAGPNHRLNIWAYDVDTKQRAQVTKFADFDVKWPSIGPGPKQRGEIVFQNGSDLHVLDLATSQTRRIEVRLPGALPTLRKKAVDAAEFMTSVRISPTGKRAVAAARGDIWTLPAENGTPRNLTATSGIAERDASWSPDGRWIAYFSDATGEYELYLIQSDGKSAARQVTSDGSAFRYQPTWSPDSEKIVFTDKTGAIWLLDVESQEKKLVDTDPLASSPANLTLSWSHDSGWLAYDRSPEGTFTSSVYLYDVASGTSHQVTAPMFNCFSPAFDCEGKYLYFISNRHFSPKYGELDSSFIYSGTEMLFCVPLTASGESPFAPKSDEEEWSEDEGEDDDSDEAEDDESDEDDADDEEEEKVVIELEGFERRAVPLPVDPGSFANLKVGSDGHLFYSRLPLRGEGGDAHIKVFDVSADDPEEKTVVKAGGFELSANGEKLLYRSGGSTYIADAAADADGEKVVTSNMHAMIDPRDEWRQLFVDSWRIQRDFFYDANMHGVDWAGIRDQYSAMLDDCVTRQDVSYVIREMISELNVGHAYYRGGDVESSPSLNVGLLGVDFEVEDGGYKFARIVEGAVWDHDARGPLSQPGVENVEGKFLHAVNGQVVTTDKDPWAWFQGLAGKTVTLTIADSANATDANSRDIIVKPLSSERNLRYRHWIEHRRAYVAEKTGGKAGYIYVPDTGVNGQNDLVRQFYGQISHGAMIIDERWNGGGQIPTRFIELLNRPITNYWARRDGADWSWPYDAHQGPKCMLINGLAGSGGDAFPAYFRQAGLGKLIGMRTWGGLVGISGNPGLIDGGMTNVPTFGYYEKDGTWGIEGHGVDPDMVVIDDPALMWDGGDPQLDAAIAHILEELKRAPYMKPARPASPDRSGMGITEADK